MPVSRTGSAARPSAGAVVRAVPATTCSRCCTRRPSTWTTCTTWPRKSARSSRTRASSSARRPANNVLLTGARGTGKSSLIKACLNGYADQGLRLIEVDKADLADLPDIVDLVAGRPERFVIFCDDLSFEEGEAGYKALKVALDGSISAQSDNVLIYATSNRRHLMPEKMSDNAGYQHGTRWRPASGRNGRRENLAVRALRFVAVVLPVPPGRLPRRSPATGWPASAARRSRSRRRGPKRCSGPCSAARARAVWPGSSPRTTQASCRIKPHERP